jgi:serine/threonine protein kinase
MADSERELIPGLPDEFRKQFRLVRLVGSGGMGHVYEAIQHSLRRRVAIKMVRAAVVGESEPARRFREEGRILAKLSHPNLVTLFDAGVVEGTPYLVIEFVEGVTLAQHLQGSTLPVESALRLVAQLLDGLEYLHGHNVIHRDLKPENIFVVDGRRVRVIDFGLAKALESSAILTRQDRVVGTPMFMAPAQFTGEPARPAWDIYAVGVILFRILTGRYPFGSSMMGGLLEEKFDLRTADVERQMSGVPGTLGKLVGRCLDAESPAPLVTAAGLREALAPWMPADTAALALECRPKAAPAPCLPAPAPSRLRWLLAVCGVCVLAAIVSIWALTPRLPMARQDGFRPAGLTLRPVEGGHALEWTTARPCQVAIHAAGRSAVETAPATSHSVVLRGLSEGERTGWRLRYPDGSESGETRLEVPRFWTVAFDARRGFRRATLRFETGVDCSAEGLLTPAAGPARPFASSNPRRVHRFDFLSLGWEHDCAVSLSLRAGDTVRRSPILRLPAPSATLQEFRRDVDRLDLQRFRDTLSLRANPDQDRRQLARAYEDRLRRIDFQSRLSGVVRLVQEAALDPGLPPGLTQVLYWEVRELWKTDLLCRLRGIPFDSGSQALRTPRFSLARSSALTGPHVREFEADLGPARLFVVPWVKNLSAGAGDGVTRRDYDLVLPADCGGEVAEVAMQVSGMAPGATYDLILNPGAGQAKLMFHPAGDAPDPVWLYHTVDARVLRPGPNRIVVRLEALATDMLLPPSRLERLVVRRLAAPR